MNILVCLTSWWSVQTFSLLSFDAGNSNCRSGFQTLSVHQNVSASENEAMTLYVTQIDTSLRSTCHSDRVVETLTGAQLWVSLALVRHRTIALHWTSVLCNLFSLTLCLPDVLHLFNHCTCPPLFWSYNSKGTQMLKLFKFIHNATVDSHHPCRDKDCQQWSFRHLYS